MNCSRRPNLQAVVAKMYICVQEMGACLPNGPLARTNPGLASLIGACVYFVLIFGRSSVFGQARDK